MPESPKGSRSEDAAVRERLSRVRILDAAIAFIDQHGVRELTMRRLGADLDVEAMALYRYVPSRDDLLDSIVDQIIDAMEDNPEVLITPQNGWQDFLQRLAHGIRQVAIDHPSAFPLLVSRPPEAPWLRPPLRSLRWVEIFLDGLVLEGFDNRAAVAAYRSFTSFLLGYLLLESAMRADDSPREPRDHGGDPVSSFPTIDRLRNELAKDRAKAEFEKGLEELIERISPPRRQGLAD